MKEITIKTNYDILRWICNWLPEIHKQDLTGAGKDIKSAYSMSYEISKKLRTKLIRKEGTRKPFNLKFAYHEAYALYLILQAQKQNIDADDFHTENAIQTLINTLDQQLT